jgi:hypothetical protein
MSDATTTPRHGNVKETLSPEEWQQHITALLDAFDFDNVVRAMKLVGWTWPSWFSAAGSPPDAARLREQAERMLRFMVDFRRDGDKSEFGGLRVVRYEDGLGMEFVLVSADSDDAVERQGAEVAQ